MMKIPNISNVRTGFGYFAFFPVAAPLIVFVISCSGGEPVTKPQRTAVTTVIAAPLSTVPEPNADRNRVPAVAPVSTTIPEQDDDPQTSQPQPVDIPAVPPEKKEITVSQEVYDSTFHQVETIIKELNTVIQSGDYQKWTDYLTDEYKQKYSNLRVLAELSETPTLKDRGIKLRSLNDYFLFVVVPSRSRVLLNKIAFLDAEHIRAFMILQDVPVILYSLRLENNIWKVTIEE